MLNRKSEFWNGDHVSLCHLSSNNTLVIQNRGSAFAYGLQEKGEFNAAHSFIYDW